MFKVYQNQIPASLIDDVLRDHEVFKRSPFSYFRAQGTTRFERPILNKYGNQINSIHNTHLLGFNRSFSRNIEKIITHTNISNCLNDFTNSKKHIWYQSMFFDNSTGTKLHQDTWYLDTIPNGKLAGVWIALEDIDRSSGPFCVYSHTDTRKIETNEFNFDDLENDHSFKENYTNAVRYDFTAKKGDILIWDSFSIHGALMPKDDSKTRKSLTAHFYPLNLKPQNPPTDRFFSIYNHKKPSKTKNSNIFKATTINPFIYQSICGAMYSIKNFKSLKSLVMSERKDEVTEIRRLKKK